MAGKNRVSRLSPAYLASRHAGMFFMLAALGLLAGVAARTLLAPTRYRAEAEVAVVVVPADAADGFDWAGKARGWRELLSDPRARGLLTGNLRHSLKLAVTQDETLDTGLLSTQLAQLDPEAEFSASLFTNGFVARLGPSISVSRGDLAGNIDFQSLAAIVSDLDPPQGAGNWDFTFFRDTPIVATRDGLVVEPGPNDRYFRVFYHLHAALNAGRPALSPLAAWRTAVDEVAARLERETRFAGGGGFGHTAKRELMREIVAIPALAANHLYHVNDWLSGDEVDEETALWRERWSRDTSVELQHDYGAAGLVVATVEMNLYPLAFPRDTVLTRLPPMGTATLLAFLSAREDRANKTAAAIAPPAPAAATSVAPAEPVRRSVEPAPAVTFKEVVDEAGARRRQAAIAAAEEKASQARLGRDAVLRRLETSRANQNRLSREALAARNRVDVLRERLDDTELASARDYTPRVPPETAALFARRDALLRRLTELLDYCTEEHPFVKEVRRELAAVESQLSAHNPDPGANREAEIRATRLATLGLEYEAAIANADNLDERHRRQGEAVACLLEEVTGCERVLAEREAELVRAREVPVPTVRVETETAVAAVVELAPLAEAPPEPIRPAATVLVEAPRLEFAATPSRIPLRRFPPGWAAPLGGLLCGILLGLLWIIARELFASRFDTVAEARRLVRLPVLAAIPAYDVKSLRTAARTMNGELARTRLGRLEFIPAPVEYAEPPPLARRGGILPARKRPRFLAWIFVLVFLLLAALAQYKSQTGFARPRVGFQGELPLPAATVRAWADESEETEDWGNLP